jgi:hypothetical protein
MEEEMKKNCKNCKKMERILSYQDEDIKKIESRLDENLSMYLERFMDVINKTDDKKIMRICKEGMSEIKAEVFAGFMRRSYGTLKKFRKTATILMVNKV